MVRLRSTLLRRENWAIHKLLPIPPATSTLPFYSPPVSPSRASQISKPSPKSSRAFLHLFFIQSCQQMLLIHTMCKNSCCSKKWKRCPNKNMHGSFSQRLKQKGTKVDSKDFYRSGQSERREAEAWLEIAKTKPASTATQLADYRNNWGIFLGILQDTSSESKLGPNRENPIAEMNRWGNLSNTCNTYSRVCIHK